MDSKNQPYRPKLGISAHLLGNAVGFDGGHKKDSFLTDTFGQFVEWVAVCPEAEIGMGTPREPVRLVGNPTQPMMIAERSGRDWTSAMTNFARRRAAGLAHSERHYRRLGRLVAAAGRLSLEQTFAAYGHDL
jgi:uncharacterized protein YbbK (DUF523 family)